MLPFFQKEKELDHKHITLEQGVSVERTIDTSYIFFFFLKVRKMCCRFHGGTAVLMLFFFLGHIFIFLCFKLVLFEIVEMMDNLIFYSYLRI